MSKSLVLVTLVGVVSATVGACGGQQSPPEAPATESTAEAPKPEMKGDGGMAAQKPMPSDMKDMPMEKK